MAHAVRAAGRSVMVYSGSTLEELSASTSVAVHSLFAAADIVVDGLFEQDRVADLLWRDSANQRIHLLTDRYAHLARQSSWPQ